MFRFELKNKRVVACIAAFGLSIGGASAYGRSIIKLKASEAPLEMPAQGSISTAKVFPAKPPARFEFRVAPIAAAFRFYSLEIAYRFSKQWSFGPAGVAYDSLGDRGNMLIPTYHGAAFGLNGTYYLQSVSSDSFYISGHAFYQKFTSYGHSFRGYSESVGARADLNFGYQWEWDSLKLRGGFGVQYDNEKGRTVFPSDGGPDTFADFDKTILLPTVEFKVGFEI